MDAHHQIKSAGTSLHTFSDQIDNSKILIENSAFRYQDTDLRVVAALFCKIQSRWFRLHRVRVRR